MGPCNDESGIDDVTPSGPSVASSTCTLPTVGESPRRLRDPVNTTSADDACDGFSPHRQRLKACVETSGAVSAPVLHDPIFIASGARLRAEVQETLNTWCACSPQFGINGTRDSWILKPASRARGTGIFVSNDVDAILRCARSERHFTTWICQKYIENPLLLGGRKHDIRQWVLITCWNPLTVWFYGECYVRLAADKYDQSDLANNMCHLTNNAIAKHHTQFDSDDDYWRCMWDERDFRKFLRAQYGFDAYETKVLPAMKRAVVATLMAVQDTLGGSRNANCCFELVGYDFLVDADLGVWLLEINTTPSMEYSTVITRRMVPEVLEDTLRVVLGDGPADGPVGRFELLHRGPAFEAERCSIALMQDPGGGICVEGRRIMPQIVPTCAPSREEIREASKRLSERRLRELDALSEKQNKRKERQKKEAQRRDRIRRVLRDKILQSKSLPDLQSGLPSAQDEPSS